MPKYFKPKQTPTNCNYQVTKKTKRGYVRDQMPCEGIYTAFEMSLIQETIPGVWLDIPKRNVGFIFGLRQIIGNYTPATTNENENK